MSCPFVSFRISDQPFLASGWNSFRPRQNRWGLAYVMLAVAVAAQPSLYLTLAAKYGAHYRFGHLHVLKPLGRDAGLSAYSALCFF